MHITKQFLLLIPVMLMLATTADARNDVNDFSISDVKATTNWTDTVSSDVRVYFGNQKHAKVVKSLGTFSTSKKTNAFGKSDKEACEWAFLSAVKQLQIKAGQMGGNAVINIKSNHNNNATSSRKTFKCAAGNIVAGVALKGTVVKLK